MIATSTQRWTCACCGKEFDELPHLVFDVPIRRSDLSWFERVRSRFDSDFCRVRHSDGQVTRLIRCVLQIPVPSIRREFGFGVWMSVSEESWRSYEEGFNTGYYEKDACFSYLMHEIPDFEGSLHLECELQFQPHRKRPLVYLCETQHPLYDAQRLGVAEAQLHTWVELLHDVRTGTQ